MMKKFLITLFCAVVAIGASAQEGKLAVNAGFLFPSTLNATIGYERPLSYGNAVELYGEAGTHWQEKDFWKSYYWDGGIVYKHRLVRYKNGMLRFRFGPQFGAVQNALIQKNNVNFLHGDTFRNGLLLGMKIPF